MSLDTDILWPCEMPAPNDLRVGDIVYDSRDPRFRGVVTCNPSEARGPFGWALDTDVMIASLSSPGVTTFSSNQNRHWVKVPPEEQTTYERVRSAAFTWSPLTERSSEVTLEIGPADDDTVGWHLLLALLSHDEAEALTDGINDWPDCADIALAVADRIDRLMRQ